MCIIMPWEGSEPISTGPEKTAPLTNTALESGSQVGDAWRSGQGKESLFIQDKNQEKKENLAVTIQL